MSGNSLGVAVARLSASILVVAAMTIAVGGCASVIEGRSQQIYVSTSPPAARCGLYREEGQRIATIEHTPGHALVEKTKADIWIVCVKSGYQVASLRNHSGVSGAAFVNVIGGIFTLGISTAIGVAVDSSNGSDNKYVSPVALTMIANGTDQSAGAANLPETFGGDLGSPAGQPPGVEASAPQVTPASAAPVAVAPAPARVPGTLPGAGIWECGVKNGSRYFKLQFVVAADHSMIVTSYANAPATIVKNDPLTLTALNPRGGRVMNIVWNADNTMVITGPTTSGGTFRNEGACTKV
jgi:hypothetical protein